MSMTMESSAFVHGQRIPVRFTGEGQDCSPPFRWQRAPQATTEFALICDDPDAPTSEPWVHWLLYNLPPSTQELPEGVPRDGRISTPVNATQGCNSWPKGKNIGYLGPMPPVGHGLHHYHFKLYALDCHLELPPGATKAELLEAMSNHVLATAEIIGTYERS
jgi:Raf kinase inhibitor-like YbhB/YbcL family protein